MLSFTKIGLSLIIASVFLTANAQTSRDVILWMEKHNNKIVYRADSKVIPPDKLLDFFGEINHKIGTEATIFVIFEDNVGLRDVEDIEGDITKVANFKIRFFFFSREFVKAKEILFTDNLVELSTFKR
jgi:hypothetical protein